jgi:hypothetical protein
MAVSGVIGGQMLVSEIIATAMQELGILASGEAPDGQETQDGIRALNWMLKSWAANGVNLWRETDGSVTFLEGVKTVELDPYCLDVLEARLVQSSTFERPLQRWENGQYLQIPNKNNPGSPTAFTLTRTTDAISMTVWPVPFQDFDVLYSYARVPYDVLDGAETLDVPQQWTETVYLGLAARIAQTFGATRIDPATAQIVTARFLDLETKMLDMDRPASTFLGSAYGRNF